MSGDAQHTGAAHGGAEHLVQMAKDIGNFFRAKPVREDAVVGIANHIAKFWDQTHVPKACGTWRRRS
jgi:hypothetical protein